MRAVQGTSLNLLLAICFLGNSRATAETRGAAGVTLDEKGHPVAGAVVLDDSDGPSVAWSFRRPGQGFLGLTDASGRWSVTNAPARLRFAHPDFLSEAVAPSSEVVLLRSGIPLRGIIVDSSGRGIEGVRVLGGDFPVWTPAGAHFEFKNCRSGQLVLVAEAPGYATSWTEVTVREPATEVRWVIPSATSRRLRVVDTIGHPVAGAEVAVEEWGAPVPWDWRWCTDTNGVVLWRNAPTGEVHCVVRKAGFHPEHNVVLARGQAGPPITLRRERTLKGLVRDESGGMVENFSVLSWDEAAEIPSWRAERPESEAKRGEFTLPLPGNAPVQVRVDAAGFESVVSRRLEPGEEVVTMQFNLRKLEQFTGVVFDLNDRPAVGAEVTWASPDAPAVLGKGSFAGGPGATVALSDQTGRFELGVPRQATTLFAAARDSGFAAAPLDQARVTGRLRLEPWGRVEGQVVFNGRPQGHRLEALSSSGITNLVFLANAFSAITDEAGHFDFRQVPPGLHQVGQVVRRRLSHAAQVEVRPGLCVSVMVGGAGTKVIGRLALPEPDPVWEDTTAPAGLRRQDKGTAFGVFYQFEFDDARTFHVESVPPGHYELEAHWHEIEPASGREVCHGAWRMNVVVAEQAEVDLGTLTWQGAAKRPRSGRGK